MIPLLPIPVFLILKLFVLLGLTIYAIFAGVIVRQERLMADVLEESFEPVLRFLVLVHFLAAIGLLILALFIL
ncbi:hypothetical protein A2Z00_01265 [Candidatus Gottesmanbacteria bacterium RBG_13_45_10]|uniref:Uncharacterized protein n=1 Tax=Candidatus Gottesmanbacteria bacterium RBG_13_45_10 TaxID=1798370 RepID=A0A1F5ZH60_9BACT|nr:MAG: hypothetical protein A2Z00_01265 [Candidatus Gottesmanbacteria bacterium RBG_13_45_10]